MYSAIVSRFLSHMLYVLFVDASDGHPILGHSARQVGRSVEIRGPGQKNCMDEEEWI